VAQPPIRVNSFNSWLNSRAEATPWFKIFEYFEFFVVSHPPGSPAPRALILTNYTLLLYNNHFIRAAPGNALKRFFLKLKIGKQNETILEKFYSSALQQLPRHDRLGRNDCF
jgi:hypothetical protein